MTHHQTVHTHHEPGGKTPYFALGVASLVAVAYGSLLPFAFEPAGDGAGLVAWPGALLWTPGPIEDWVTNLVLYLPAGILLRMGLRGRGWPVAVQLLGPACIIAFAALGIEAVQQVMPDRCASLCDLVANAGGGFLGAVSGPLAIGALRRRARWGVGKLKRFVPPQAGGWRAGLALGLFAAAAVAFFARWGGWFFLAGAFDTDAAVDVVWLPGLREFWLPYDEGLPLLATGLAGYVWLVAAVFLIGRGRLTARHRLAAGIAAATALVAGLEMLHGVVLLRTIDVTGPALAAAGFAAFVVLRPIIRRFALYV